MFTSIMSSIDGSLSIENALLCTAVSLILGIIIALAYMAQGSYTKNFVITLIILPVLVQAVIMLVNGNLGTSVAVMGAFSLVRFRSLPGTARDITAIFFAMVIGLATGMGFLTYAGIIGVIVALAMIVLDKIKFLEDKNNKKDLRITIPENLDYAEVFDDILQKYTNSNSLERVKTTNLGSMFELTYRIELKDEKKEKEFIDELRCRNGNLTIMCTRPIVGKEEL